MGSELIDGGAAGACTAVVELCALELRGLELRALELRSAELCSLAEFCVGIGAAVDALVGVVSRGAREVEDVGAAVGTPAPLLVVGASVARVRVGEIVDGTTVGTLVRVLVLVGSVVLVGDVEVRVEEQDGSEIDPTEAPPAVTKIAVADAGAVRLTPVLPPGTTGVPAGVTVWPLGVVKLNVCVAVDPFVSVTNT